MAAIAEELLDLLDKLPTEQQQRVLEYARVLAQPRPALAAAAGQAERCVPGVPF